MSISIEFATIPNGCISPYEYLESRIFRETVNKLKRHNISPKKKLPDFLLSYQILDMKAQVQALGYEEFFNSEEGNEILLGFAIKIISHRYNEIIRDLSADVKAMFLEILSK